MSILTFTVRIPASNGHAFTREEAETAVGKPLLDRVGDGARQVGKIREAHQERGDLVALVEVDNVAVQFDLAANAVRNVSLAPRPRVVG